MTLRSRNRSGTNRYGYIQAFLTCKIEGTVHFAGGRSMLMSKETSPMYIFHLRSCCHHRRSRSCSKQKHSLIECNIGVIQKLPFGVNTVSELKIIPIKPTIPAKFVVETYPARCHFFGCISYVI